jgi:hypothetical protein
LPLPVILLCVLIPNLLYIKLIGLSNSIPIFLTNLTATLELFTNFSPAFSHKSTKTDRNGRKMNEIEPDSTPISFRTVSIVTRPTVK